LSLSVALVLSVSSQAAERQSFSFRGHVVGERPFALPSCAEGKGTACCQPARQAVTACTLHERLDAEVPFGPQLYLFHEDGLFSVQVDAPAEYLGAVRLMLEGRYGPPVSSQTGAFRWDFAEGRLYLVRRLDEDRQLRVVFSHATVADELARRILEEDLRRGRGAF
jgi:hypothetical protein